MYRHLCLSLAFALLPLTATQAAVQSADIQMDDLLDLSLEDLMSIRVTSATLMDERVTTVPASITVFTHADIQALGVRSLEDLMNHVPGFQSTSRNDIGAGQHAFSSRGRRIGSSFEILFLLDGIRLNKDYSGGLGQADRDLGLDNIERVEFIRGPGSAIYGSNAFMGVVNLVTAQHRNDVGISAGNHGQKNAYINASYPAQDSTRGISVFASTRQDDGEALQLYSLAEQTEKSSRDPNTQQEVYVQGHWGHWAAKWRTRSTTSEQYFVEGYVGNSVNDMDSNSTYANLVYDNALNEQWRINASSSVTTSEVTEFGAVAPQVVGNVDIDTRETGVDVTAFWQHQQHRAVVGMALRRPDIATATFNLYATGIPLNAANNSIYLGEDRRTYRSAFAQWQSELWRGGSYITGIRYDDDSLVGSHISPRLGLIQQLTEQQTLKLLYGEAFRAPSTWELYLNPSTGTYQGNPDLLPEVNKTTELVWIFIGSHHAFSGTLFNTTLKDGIVATNTIPLTYINTGTSSIAGIETEWQWALSRDFKLRSTATHFFDPAADIYTEASTLFSIDLLWSHERWSAAVSDGYKGAVEDPDSSTAGYHRLASRNLLDLHIAYAFLPKWQLFMHAENLLDKQYSEPANSGGNIIGVPGQGRGVVLGIRGDF